MRWVGTALLTLMLAASASAETDVPFAVPDGCGDVDQAIIRTEQTTINLETDRGPWHDIDRAALTTRPDGSLDAELKLCGAVPAPQAFVNEWSVNVDVANDCDITISVADDSYGNPTRVGRLSKWCTTTSTNPLGFSTTTYAEDYSVDLPASSWTLNGDTISWHITKAQLIAAGAGKTLKDPTAGVTDGAAVGIWYGTTAVHGPGGTDKASAAGSIALS
jgi:hypothetical protein